MVAWNNTKKFSTGTSENRFQSSENIVETPVDKISSSVSFHRYFKVFHTKFNTWFWHLMLKIISFWKDIYTSHTEVCNSVQIIPVQSFCPIVTPASSGFCFNIFFSLHHCHITYLNEIVLYQYPEKNIWVSPIVITSQTYGLWVVSQYKLSAYCLIRMLTNCIFAIKEMWRYVSVWILLQQKRNLLNH